MAAFSRNRHRGDEPVTPSGSPLARKDLPRCSQPHPRPSFIPFLQFLLNIAARDRFSPKGQKDRADQRSQDAVFQAGTSCGPHVAVPTTGDHDAGAPCSLPPPIMYRQIAWLQGHCHVVACDPMESPSRLPRDVCPHPCRGLRAGISVLGGVG